MRTALVIIDIQYELCSGEEAAFGIDSVIEEVNALSGRAAGVLLAGDPHPARRG